MVNIEGQIRIDIYPRISGPGRVQISSTRPLQAINVMLGKTPETALSRIPLLFNICAVAQARTAISAMQHNLGKPADPAIETARDMLVLVETAREHLSRIFIDWPALLDTPVDQKPLAGLGSLIKDFKHALFVEGDAFSFDSRLNAELSSLHQHIERLQTSLNNHVFGIDHADWLDLQNLEELQQWQELTQTLANDSIDFILSRHWGNQGASDCEPLPELDSVELNHRLDAENSAQFIQQPDWFGKLYETTPLSRQLQHPLIQALQNEYGNGLITRWVARLVELARIPHHINQLLDQLVNINTDRVDEETRNNGLANTEAARGRLIHRVNIEQGKISKYQILAPTEWNFHPQGLIYQSLSSLIAENTADLEKLSRLIINTIDPCVGYELRIH